MSEDQYEVTIVKYGTRQTTKNDVYLNYSLYGEPDAPIGMDYFFWVVRNPVRTILVDTGFSKIGGESRQRTLLVQPREAYEELGVKLDSAPTVVVTHAHYDHIGNLGLVPDSDLVLTQAEYEFWTGPLAHKAQFHHSVEDSELHDLERACREKRIRAFAGQYEVAPGITLRQLGGHTPGQCVVRVETSEGPVLLTSDAVHYYDELNLDRPFVSATNVADMYSGFDTIREMVADGSVAHVVSGHDPDTLNRFKPLTGALAGLAATIGVSA